MARINYLTIENIHAICYELAKELFNTIEYPMPAFQYLHKDRMESALESIKFNYYKNIFEKAGTLGYQIIKGHALLDGNKRIGITATMVFLMDNGFIIDVPPGKLLKVALDIADEKTNMSKNEFIGWLKHNCRKFDLSKN